jgi:hypothetical protein
MQSFVVFIFIDVQIISTVTNQNFLKLFFKAFKFNPSNFLLLLPLYFLQREVVLVSYCIFSIMHLKTVTYPRSCGYLQWKMVLMINGWNLEIHFLGQMYHEFVQVSSKLYLLLS